MVWRVPEHEDAVLAVAVVTEDGHALATGLGGDQGTELVGQGLRLA